MNKYLFFIESKDRIISATIKLLEKNYFSRRGKKERKKKKKDKAENTYV